MESLKISVFVHECFVCTLISFSFFLLFFFCVYKEKRAKERKINENKHEFPAVHALKLTALLCMLCETLLLKTVHLKGKKNPNQSQSQ